MSLEKFLRTHAASFERKPWLSLEEQVEEAFEDAVKEAADQAEEEAHDVAYDDGLDAGRQEMREEMCEEILAIIGNDDLSNNQKIAKIEEYCK